MLKKKKKKIEIPLFSFLLFFFKKKIWGIFLFHFYYLFDDRKSNHLYNSNRLQLKFHLFFFFMFKLIIFPIFP